MSQPQPVAHFVAESAVSLVLQDSSLLSTVLKFVAKGDAPALASFRAAACVSKAFAAAAAADAATWCDAVLLAIPSFPELLGGEMPTSALALRALFRRRCASKWTNPPAPTRLGLEHFTFELRLLRSCTAAHFA